MKAALRSLGLALLAATMLVAIAPAANAHKNEVAIWTGEDHWWLANGTGYVQSASHDSPFTGDLLPFDGAINFAVSDQVKDGHCVYGRVHIGGRWQTKVVDCSHDREFESQIVNIRAGQWVAVSVCVGPHRSSTACKYDWVKT